MIGEYDAALVKEIRTLTAERDALRRQLEDVRKERDSACQQRDDLKNAAIEALSGGENEPVYDWIYRAGRQLADARAALEIISHTDICSERVAACERCKTNAAVARAALAKMQGVDLSALPRCVTCEAMPNPPFLCMHAAGKE